MLASSGVYGQYVVQGQKTERRSVRARIDRLVSEDKAEVTLLAAGSRETVEAEFPGRYRDILYPGDLCVVAVPGDGRTAEILGPLRDRAILALFALFVIVVVLTMGVKGLRTLLSLCVAAVLMLYVFLPLTSRGWGPIWLAVWISVVVCTTGILVVGGANRKSGTQSRGPSARSSWPAGSPGS